ncbi:hypothetical protein [Virgibacillus necropolis]|uniref:Addiction module toxin RelE n=1 Tax=Virgibacillus necropolis TaxID=163877 RepID=A0A221MFF1_9BACI|nr:hypothetical protein [Virgibacillus necropolis]ASN06364.1 hypothetical protein CFK40_15720 [Virgibacillus necropolis]
MNMGNEFWHEEIINFDLTIIAAQIQDFDVFYDSFTDSINKAKQKPFRPGWDLRYDLKEWFEYKFFSMKDPSLKDKPDMRFVYYYDRDYKNIYILAVGWRNAKETRSSDEQQSIFYIASERLKNYNPGCWRKIR